MTKAKLNADLRQAIAIGTPVEVIDPSTNDVYYLISAAQFRAIAGSISPDFDPREGYPLIEQLMATEDEHDPLLDSYQ